MKALLTPATLTVGIGALAAVCVGVLDAWAFHHAFGDSVDLALVLSGLAALLGHNPSQLPAA